jgi:uncharacterized protein YggT (Ycf19 family)
MIRNRTYYVAVDAERAKEPDMALLLLIAQTLILIAGLALMSQFIVGVFNWGRREENVVYQLLAIVTRPAVRVVRRITPRAVIDRHVPIVAFLLCLFAYFAVGYYHRDVCLTDLTQRGCQKWLEARSR